MIFYLVTITLSAIGNIAKSVYAKNCIRDSV